MVGRPSESVMAQMNDPSFSKSPSAASTCHKAPRGLEVHSNVAGSCWAHEPNRVAGSCETTRADRGVCAPCVCPRGISPRQLRSG